MEKRFESRAGKALCKHKTLPYNDKVLILHYEPPDSTSFKIKLVSLKRRVKEAFDPRYIPSSS